MPLNPVTLQDQILRITGAGRPEHEGFPADEAAVAARWSGALRAYFAEVVVPSVLPVGLDAAREAMQARMLADLALGGPAALVNGIVAFGAALAGVALTPVAVPPPAPPMLPALPPTSDPMPPAAALAAAVHAWALTGTVVPPPAGPAIPWS